MLLRFAFITLSFAAAASSASSSQLSIGVVGDWGGIPFWPYKTPGEVGTAKALGNLAGSADIGSLSAVLALGDNFYFDGVKNVDDPRFKNTFEDVFTADSLKGDNLWKICAGNHDWRGNVSAQMAYSDKSARWHYPALYYTFRLGGGAVPTVDVFLVDTVTLTGYGNQSVDEAQWTWLENGLAKSDADYVIVGGVRFFFSFLSRCFFLNAKFLFFRSISQCGRSANTARQACWWTE